MNVNKKIEKRINNINEMKVEIGNSNYLKEIFDESWFDELEKQIRDSKNYYGKNQPFHTKTHYFFIDYINNLFSKNLLMTNLNIISLLDESCMYIQNCISDEKKVSFYKKLEGFKSHNLAQYAGNIFEVITLGKFARYNFLKEYEPRIDNSTDKTADALIEIGNEKIVVEITSSKPEFFGKKSYEIESSIDSVFLDVPEIVRKIMNKVYSKYRQTELSKFPILLILCNASSMVDKDEIFIALKKLKKSSKLGNIFLVALSGSHFSDPNHLFLIDSSNLNTNSNVISEINNFYNINFTVLS